MRTSFPAIGLCLLASSLAVHGETTGTCEQKFEAKFRPGGDIRLRIRSADIEVTGSNSDAVRVTCELRHDVQARNITIRFTADRDSASLYVRGGPNDGVKIRIEVPKSSNLFVRAPAGDLTLSGVTGDKDVEIHAGDLTISVGNPGDYKHADGSVWAGDLSASAFGVTKDGLFRSFDKDNASGKYRLHAHVGAGDLVLK
jgi:hypothetical protein